MQGTPRIVFQEPEKTDESRNSSRLATESRDEESTVNGSSGNLSCIPLQRDGMPKRKLARGFTITVSAPPDDGGAAGSDGGSSDTLHAPDDSAYGEGMPPLDKTESRLPSLEDLLADQEIQKMLNTSETHREVQEALVEEDDQVKHSRLMDLVQRSFEDLDWRQRASNDRALLDTLVLFCRQRLSTAFSPAYHSPADPLRRSQTRKSSGSRSFSRSLTVDSGASPRSSGLSSAAGGNHSSTTPGGSQLGGSISPGASSSPSNPLGGSFASAAEMISKCGTSVALVGVTMKLLRNLCARSASAQTYLHEHRLIDFVVDHIDTIAEMHHLADCNGGNGGDGMKKSESSCLLLPDVYFPRPAFPEWAEAELSRIPRTTVQLVTNIAAGSPSIALHVLKHIIPVQLLKLIVTSGDSELLCCLLHTLIAKQSDEELMELFFPTQPQTHYPSPDEPAEMLCVLFCFALKAAHTAEVPIATWPESLSASCENFQIIEGEGKAADASVVTSSLSSSDGEWASIFAAKLFSLMSSKPDSTGAFIQLLNVANREWGPQRLDALVVDVMLNRHSAVLKDRKVSVTKSTSPQCSRRGSLGEGPTVLSATPAEIKERFAAPPRGELVSYLWQLAESLSSGQALAASEPSPMMGGPSAFPLSFLMSECDCESLEKYLRESVQELKAVAATGGAKAEASFIVPLRAFVRFCCSLSALAATSDSAERIAGYQRVKNSIVKLSLELLNIVHPYRAKALDGDADGFELISVYLSTRDVLLLLANSLLKDSQAQAVFADSDGVRAVLNNTVIDERDPLLREAAVYAIKCGCPSRSPGQIQLASLLEQEFKGVLHPQDETVAAEAVIGRFDPKTKAFEISHLGNRKSARL